MPVDVTMEAEERDQHPWLGLDAFTEELSEYFYGRDRESEELFRRVRRETLTVLFGLSGLGKTSLLRAGLFPALRVENFLPVYVRFDHSSESMPLESQVKQAIADVIKTSGIAQPSVPAESDTLWEFFHREKFSLRSWNNQQITPVLVFDQFEELFTLGSRNIPTRNRQRAFVTEMADLIENRPPRHVMERLRGDPAQLESLDFGPAKVRVLLSLREDYLAHLEAWAELIPSLGLNRIRLTPMNGLQALEAVMLPGDDLVTKEVAQQIVQFVSAAGRRSEGSDHAPTTALRDIEVEPALLSLLCHELNARRLAAGQDKITSELVETSGARILQDFYAGCFAELPAGARVFVEQELLTPDGHRDDMDVRRARELLKELGAPAACLETLIDRRLLHLVRRGETQRVELTHDLLTGVACGSRDARLVREAQQAEHQRQRDEERKLRREKADAERRLAEQRRLVRWMRAAGLVITVIAVFAGIQWARASGAEKIAQRKIEEAERLRKVARTEALNMRKQISADKNTIIDMTDRLIALTSGEEAIRWRLHKGDALSVVGRHFDAIRTSASILEIDPQHIEANAALGYFYLLVGDQDKALEHSNIALRHDPTRWYVYQNQAIALAALGRYEEAVTALRRSMEWFQHAAGTYCEYQLSPDIQKATGRTIISSQERAQLGASLCELANLEAFSGGNAFEERLRPAEKPLQSIDTYLTGVNWAWLHIKARPEDYGALAAQGIWWELAGFKPWARRAYEGFESKHATRKDARYNNLHAWVGSRLIDLQYEDANDEDRDHDTLVFDAWDYEQRDGDFIEAQRCLDKAIEMEPSNPSSLLLRGWLLFRRGQDAERRGDSSEATKYYNAAKTDCDGVLAKDPRSSSAYKCRAFANEKLGRPPEILKADFRKALQYSPRDLEAVDRLKDLETK